MKIVTVLGARPQFIKAATVSRIIHAHNELANDEEIQEVIVHTGQHFDENMSDVFFKQLDIPHPAYNLGVSNLGHGAMTGRMLEGIEELILREKPDLVLVYGDTNSTLAGALAAVKLHIPVAHVEAGLRSHNAAMPEEINRVLTDRVSTLLFCPTRTSVNNLNCEGYPFSVVGNRKQEIALVGDVMYDAVLYYRNLVRNQESLDVWGLNDNEYALCTLHRQENTDNSERLSNILAALREINRNIPVIIPLHPRTKNLLSDNERQDWLKGLIVVDPVPYLEMQRLEMGANVILTDSGGIQKEAYFHHVPCITLRDETEWVETVELGWNQVVGADEGAIMHAIAAAIKPPESIVRPYGDGNAAKLIVNTILH